MGTTVVSVTAGTETLTEAVAEPSTGPPVTDTLPVIVTPELDAGVETGADASDVVALEGSATSVETGGNSVAIGDDVELDGSLETAVVVVDPAVGSDVVEPDAVSLEVGDAVFVIAGDEVDTAMSVEGSKIVVIEVLGIAVLAPPVLLAGSVDVESAVGAELVVEVVVLLGESVGSAVTAALVLVVEPAVGTSVEVVAGLVVAAALDVVEVAAEEVVVDDTGAEVTAAPVLVAGPLTLEDCVTEVLVGSETLETVDVGATVELVALDVDDDVAGSGVVGAAVEDVLTGEGTAGTELVAAGECEALDVTTPRDDECGNKLATGELGATEDGRSVELDEAVCDAT